MGAVQDDAEHDAWLCRRPLGGEDSGPERLAQNTGHTFVTSLDLIDETIATRVRFGVSR